MTFLEDDILLTITADMSDEELQSDFFQAGWMYEKTLSGIVDANIDWILPHTADLSIEYLYSHIEELKAQLMYHRKALMEIIELREQYKL